jgi:putative membrane protein insertion efficiency factor
MGTQTSFLPRLLLGLIALYQAAVSPLLGHKCRFVPSCSCYAQDALREHGLRGLTMILKRIARCHPFTKNEYQYDPVRK